MCINHLMSARRALKMTFCASSVPSVQMWPTNSGFVLRCGSGDLYDCEYWTIYWDGNLTSAVALICTELLHLVNIFFFLSFYSYKSGSWALNKGSSWHHLVSINPVYIVKNMSTVWDNSAHVWKVHILWFLCLFNFKGGLNAKKKSTEYVLFCVFWDLE